MTKDKLFAKGEQVFNKHGEYSILKENNEIKKTKEIQTITMKKIWKKLRI